MANLSTEDIEKIVKSAFKGNVTILSHDQQPYSEKKMGFLGYHGRLTIKIRDQEGNIQDMGFFFKSIPYNNDIQKGFIEEIGVFEEETNFYNEYLPKLRSNFAIEDWSPKIYLVKSDIIVMEDLRLSGFKMVNIPLAEDEIQCAISTVARFHASTILAENQNKKSFLELYPDSFQEKLSKTENGQRYFKAGIEAIVSAAMDLELDEVERLPNIIFKSIEFLKPSSSHRNVICHCDLWIYNFMFDDSLKCVLVDFQTIRYAPMVIDLLHIFYVNTERKFRAKWEYKLIQHYYKVLSDTIRRNNKSVDFPSFEDIWTDYENFRLFGTAVALIELPMALYDEVKKEEIMQDPEAFYNFCFNDRREYIIEYLHTNEAYKNIIKETILEAIEIDKKQG